TLAAVVAAGPGLGVPGAWDTFELGVRAILGQQITVAGATTLAGRLVQAHGIRLNSPDAPGELTHIFPDAKTLAAVNLTKVGVPTARANALLALAGAAA